MEQLTCERLRENLARLKLARINEILDATVTLAEKEKMSYLSFLDRIFEEEVAAKEKKKGRHGHADGRSPLGEDDRGI